MIDLIKLMLQAGAGGHGRVSYRREKYAPMGGPDGGKGGNGGDIIIRASRHVATLQQFSGKTEFVAQSGGMGGKRNKTGREGDSVVLEVPLGTEVWQLAENNVARRRRNSVGLHNRFNRSDIRGQVYEVEKAGQGVPERDHDAIEEVPKDKDQSVLIAELLENGQEIVICQGGFGGNGNMLFKGPERTTPLIAEYGSEGEQRAVYFELKLLADIGLVGYPNAGKSTLVSSLTGAQTKIGAYPFTTLEPHLGILRAGKTQGEQRELVVADIPGLIEGSSKGKGLGHTFLRHVEHTRVLWFVLALDEALLFDSTVTEKERAKMLWNQFQTLKSELREYGDKLLTKPFLISINKIDLYTPEQIDALKKLFTTKKEQAFFISAATGEGVDAVKKKLFEFAVE